MSKSLPIKQPSLTYKGKLPTNITITSKLSDKPTENVVYKCTSCGEEFKSQKNNFYISKSPLYEMNNGFLTVCKQCVDGRYIAALEVCDQREDKAIELMCQTFDWYYSPVALNYAINALSDGQTLLRSYISRLSLSHVSAKGTTYLDTVKANMENDPEVIAAREELEKRNAPPQPKEVSEAVRKKWGTGFTPDEYEFLEDHYTALAGKIIEGDDVSESIVRDLCQLKVLQNRAAKANDDAAYVKYQKAYTDTLKSPDLRSAKSKGGAATDAQASWGKFIEMVEKYTPAEYYKDDKMFDDASGIKDYFKRFFVRPFKNFFTGSTELDPEYSVKQEDVESD